MAKKQINISSDSLRNLVMEAVKEYKLKEQTEDGLAPEEGENNIDNEGTDDYKSIAGLEEGNGKKSIRLTEGQMREFISYSVARLIKEACLGHKVHFNGESSFKPENPYKGMSWEEYCRAKEEEHKKENSKLSDRDLHFFDDKYWTDKNEDDKL